MGEWCLQCGIFTSNRISTHVKWEFVKNKRNSCVLLDSVVIAFACKPVKTYTFCKTQFIFLA
jgi:hypothetical protein